MDESTTRHNRPELLNMIEEEKEKRNKNKHEEKPVEKMNEFLKNLIRDIKSKWNWTVIEYYENNRDMLCAVIKTYAETIGLIVMTIKPINTYTISESIPQILEIKCCCFAHSYVYKFTIIPEKNTILTTKEEIVSYSTS